MSFLFLAALCLSWHMDVPCGVWAWLPQDVWDLSFLTRDQTCVPCIGRQVLNPWTTKEVLVLNS